MGERKIPKKPPVRPFMAIARMQATVNTAAMTPNMDEDSKAVIADIGAVLAWVSHLEGEEKHSGEMSAVKPN